MLAVILVSPAAVTATLVYSTDFGNVNLNYAEPHNDNSLSMAVSNAIIYDTYNYGATGPGATSWIEGSDKTTPGVTCHSGSRCLGMELFDITKSRRNEFAIQGLDAQVGNQIYVSVWLYLPPGWQTHTPSGSSWYEIADMYAGSLGASYSPYGEIIIAQTPPSPNFELQVNYVTPDDAIHYLYVNSNFPLPIGRWFNLQYYVLRSTTNGRVVVWLDGQLLVDASGFDTGSGSPDWFTVPAKIYYNQNDSSSPHRIWVDDLEIWTREPSIPGFPWESTLLGVIIGLGAVAVMRRRRNLTL
jgi:hypothetical protein